MIHITEQDFDHLALEGCELVGFQFGLAVPYDVAGYDRVMRMNKTPDQLNIRSAARAEIETLPVGVAFEDYSYSVYLAGFRCGEIFQPDEIGALLREKNIYLNDGLADNLGESLMIDRKYGLSLVLQAPAHNLQAPFLLSELSEYEKAYRKVVVKHKIEIEKLELENGCSLRDRQGKRLMVLMLPEYPLAIFARGWNNNPVEVSEELYKEIGLLAPIIRPKTSQERSSMVRFWNLLRRRWVEALEIHAKILREEFGRDLRLLANYHELPPLDMQEMSRVYDIPAIALRPLLVDDEMMQRHYVAYFIQLAHDLMGKSPYVSLRTNLSAASPRYVPASSEIRRWYDQAVRHGAGGFHFWTVDYPTTDLPGEYMGVMLCNPEKNTLPTERWETNLDILSLLATHKRFLPPQGEVAILVPTESALLDRKGWRKIFSAFSACAEARIHIRFVSDRSFEKRLPENLRLLIMPLLEFISPELRCKLSEFTQSGGVLLGAYDQLFDHAGNPNAELEAVIKIDHQSFDIFPLTDIPNPLYSLQRSAAFLRREIESRMIDDQSWVFDFCCENLLPTDMVSLRDSEPSIILKC